jgi:flagellar FliJ protein
MKRSKRLQVIVDLKANQEQQALQTFGKCQGQHQEAVKQIEHLTNYRQEYLDKFNVKGSAGVSIHQLQEFRAFVIKLDTAIAGQEKVLQDLTEKLTKKRKVWLQAHQKTNSLQKVQDSAVNMEQIQVEKREQKEQDERASRTGRSSGMDDA